MSVIVGALKKLDQYTKQWLKPGFEGVIIWARNDFDEHLYIIRKSLLIHDLQSFNSNVIEQVGIHLFIGVHALYALRRDAGFLV